MHSKIICKYSDILFLSSHSPKSISISLSAKKRIDFYSKNFRSYSPNILFVMVCLLACNSKLFSIER